MHFTAPWGRMLKIASVLVTVVLLDVVVLGILRIPPQPERLRWLMIGAPLVILVGTAPFTIRGYRVEGSSLLIERLFWNTRLSLGGLREASVMRGALKKSVRVAGNGGLFSFTGFYWNRELGRFRAFVTDLDRTVVLRMTERTLVVSPDDPDAFVRAVKAGAELAR